MKRSKATRDGEKLAVNGWNEDVDPLLTAVPKQRGDKSRIFASRHQEAVAMRNQIEPRCVGVDVSSDNLEGFTGEGVDE